MLTDIQKIRMRLGDSLTLTVDKQVGDGVVTLYYLTHKHIQNLEVAVNNNPVDEGTDYTVDYDDGVINFKNAPADQAPVRMQYMSGAFNDADLQNLLESYGTVTNAINEAIKILMADAARRFDYVHGQTQMNPSQIFDHLKQLLEINQASDTPMVMNLGKASAYKPRLADLSRTDCFKKEIYGED